jgi:hypothetical protein
VHTFCFRLRQAVHLSLPLRPYLLFPFGGSLLTRVLLHKQGSISRNGECVYRFFLGGGPWISSPSSDNEHSSGSFEASGNSRADPFGCGSCGTSSRGTSTVVSFQPVGILLVVAYARRSRRPISPLHKYVSAFADGNVTCSPRKFYLVSVREGWTKSRQGRVPGKQTWQNFD